MILVFLANGFEEIEALAPVDIMRRAGIEVLTVGVGEKTVFGSHNIGVTADVTADMIIPDEKLEGIVLPGGLPGTTNLEKDKKVNEFIDFALENNLLISAICAAPSVLGHKGILKGKNAICYPGFEDELFGAKLSEKSVVRDQNIITGKGAGVALDFGFEIVSYLKGSETALKIKDSMKCIL